MWAQSLSNENSQRSFEINLNDLNEALMPNTLETQVADLVTQVQQLSAQLNERQPPKIEPYKDVTVTITQPNEVSLHIFKTLPEFNGERDKYPTWRSTTQTAMKLLSNHKETIRYFEALMIIRNKITGPASNIINNYNTAFNFEAIIDRLDFTYAEKRPLYILEQELLVLQQNRSTTNEFYDQVNEKLNHIVNKINMTYKDVTVANAFIEGANVKALRTFITGLNNRRGELLYASNPGSLPEAYARLQTITNDQERIQFANRYNHKAKEREREQFKNPQFRAQLFDEIFNDF